MKKISQGGQGKTPPGLSKKDYVSPEPFILINGTVVWPWDDSYDAYNILKNANGIDGSTVFADDLTSKHGKNKVHGNPNK